MTMIEGTSMRTATRREMPELVTTTATRIATTDPDNNDHEMPESSPSPSLYRRCALSHGVRENRWMPDLPVK